MTESVRRDGHSGVAEPLRRLAPSGTAVERQAVDCAAGPCEFQDLTARSRLWIEPATLEFNPDLGR
jgi:hypothetical protein